MSCLKYHALFLLWCRSKGDTWGSWTATCAENTKSGVLPFLAERLLFNHSSVSAWIPLLSTFSRDRKKSLQVSSYWEDFMPPAAASGERGSLWMKLLKDFLTLLLSRRLDSWGRRTKDRWMPLNSTLQNRTSSRRK